MKTEWTIEQVRAFVKNDYQSVSARMVKCLLSIMDAQQFKDGPQWISVDNDYPECAAGERNYSIDVEAKFPDGNTCKGHFELEDGYFYDGDTLYQYLEKPTHWRSLSSTAESGQRTPADDAVEDKDFDAWLEKNYQESNFKGFWIDRDNWIDKNNPYYRMEDLKRKYQSK